jgi:hypothetical protein
MGEGRVVHCKREPYDVYIGRPGRWGNPFQITGNQTREDAIAAYRRWVASDPHAAWVREHVHELRGKTLGCWCSPKPCHGDVLLELAAQDGGEGEQDG